MNHRKKPIPEIFKEISRPTKYKILFAFLLLIIVLPITDFLLILTINLLLSSNPELTAIFYIFGFFLLNPLFSYYLSSTILFLFGKTRLSLLLIPVLFVIFVFLSHASHTGLPETTSLQAHGCVVEYTKYNFPRLYCQISSGGHCSTNYLKKNNAQYELSQCLCDKYHENQSKDIEQTLIELCLDNSNCKIDCTDEKLNVDYICEKVVPDIQEYIRCFSRIGIM
jgi:hypothetical protein